MWGDRSQVGVTANNSRWFYLRKRFVLAFCFFRIFPSKKLFYWNGNFDVNQYVCHIYCKVGIRTSINSQGITWSYVWLRMCHKRIGKETFFKLNVDLKLVNFTLNKIFRGSDLGQSVNRPFVYQMDDFNLKTLKWEK